MDRWLTEKQTEGFQLQWRLKQTLYEEKTEFQELAVVELDDFGRTLLLDGVVQTTEGDEFIYHEMLAHVPLCAHPKPQQVLVIGGGDGGTVREVLRHPTVKQVELVEIDRRVVEICRQYLPHHTSGLDNPRATIHYQDGIEFVKSKSAAYDVILVDAPDPVGPAEGLFNADFYRSVHRALKDDGIMAVQGESPVFNRPLIQELQRILSEMFAYAGLYLVSIPTYPGGLWSFSIASKVHKPEKPMRTLREQAALRYYTPEVHQAAFVLPPWIEELLYKSKQSRSAVS